MANGGARPGAGRPKGATNKKTRELQAKAEASGILPLDLMLSVMRELWDEGTREAKLAAHALARDAAPYLHARLTSTTLEANVKNETHEERLKRLASE